MLTPSLLYVGGTEDTFTKTRKEIQSNFVGTIEDVSKFQILFHTIQLPLFAQMAQS